MSTTELLIFIILYIILPYAGLWKMFEKAGVPGWKGAVPILNAWEMIKLSGRPKWWLILVLLPIINILFLIGLTLDFVKSFGKFKFSEHAAAVVLPFIYLYKWGTDKETKYIGPAVSPEFKEKHKVQLRKSGTREWTEAIIFAVIAATLIRTFFIEAYVIPTPSMERSLLVGDFLFVSKVNYGPRLPETPIAFPFAHNTMPVTGSKSYWDGLEMPYYRLPGLEQIKRGDVVVFNYPADTNIRPVDKRENYIKRCQGIPGDTLKVVGGQVYVNGKAMPNPPGEQMEYKFTAAGSLRDSVLNKLQITLYPGHGAYAMTKASADIYKNLPDVKGFKPDTARRDSTDQYVFPGGPVSLKDTALGTNFPNYHWNADNFGPIIIPKKGWTVKLDSVTFPIYERCIEVYENNKLEIRKDGQLYINGVQTYSYTFKMNYYWMMGDNRHDSEDSRFWGFVPEDHIVGKALFIWMSWDDQASGFFSKIRWSRLFNGIH